MHVLDRVVNIHTYFKQVVYTTLYGEWYAVFHWVSKRMHVMWYTSGDS